MAKKTISKSQAAKAKSGLFIERAKLGGKFSLKQLKQVKVGQYSSKGSAAGIYTAKMELRSTPVLIQVVSEGVPVSDAKKLIHRYKVESRTLAKYVGDSPAKFIKRKPSERLKLEKSERLVRLARLMSAAEALHEGDAEAARRWMENPNRALGGEIPLEYARTEVGAREVEQLIGRLEHGVVS